MKSCSVRSKRLDQYQSDNREANDKTKPFIITVFVSFDFGCDKKEVLKKTELSVSLLIRFKARRVHLVFAFQTEAS